MSLRLLRVKNKPFSNTQNLGKLHATYMTHSKYPLHTKISYKQKRETLEQKNEQGQLEMNRIRNLNEVRQNLTSLVFREI